MITLRRWPVDALVVLALASIPGCSDPALVTPPAPPTTDSGTALIAASLTMLGEVHIDTVVTRAFEFVGAGVPFDPELHAPTLTGSEAARVPPTDALRAPRGAGSLAPDDRHVAANVGAGVVVVSHPSRATPFVAPLEWGSPGEGAGDVASRWDGGSAIWRAPYYGPGTRYTIVRTTPGPAAELASWEVKR